MYVLGTHLLVELRECNPTTLNNLNDVQDVLVSAAKIAKATIIDVVFHEFSPFGISGMVIIAESHLSIHTWPEHIFWLLTYAHKAQSIAPCSCPMCD